ncbi:MAG: hypothetical protein ABSD39_12460 [Terriglobales bacterium]|jgi:hypothetical protein
MNLQIILAIVAILFFLFLIVMSWQWLSTRGEAAPAGELIPVDLEAFQNLTDPEEEQFLRTSLSPPEFRSVQRIRIRAAKLYVVALSDNAGSMMRLGNSASLQADQAIVALGRDIAKRALSLKMWCAVLQLRLTAALVFPTILSPTGGIADQYLAVTYMAAKLHAEAAA